MVRRLIRPGLGLALIAAGSIGLAWRNLRDAEHDQHAAIEAGLNGAVYATTRANIAAERIRIAKSVIALVTGAWLYTVAPAPSEQTRRAILGAWVLVSILDGVKSYILRQARQAVQANERRRMNAEEREREEGG